MKRFRTYYNPLTLLVLLDMGELVTTRKNSQFMQHIRCLEFDIHSSCIWLERKEMNDSDIFWVSQGSVVVVKVKIFL